MPDDPPTDSQQQSPLSPPVDPHDQEREQLIRDLAFLVVQQHRRKQRNRSLSTIPNPQSPK